MACTIDAYRGGLTASVSTRVLEEAPKLGASPSITAKDRPGAATLLLGQQQSSLEQPNSNIRPAKKDDYAAYVMDEQTANAAGQYNTPPAVPNTSYALTAVGAPRVECTASDASRHTSPPRRTWRGSKTTPSEGEEEHKGARGQEAEGVFEKHEP